jgi:L-alanine-DL-glutamate epimerase-like enolase superfamily enzyme
MALWDSKGRALGVPVYELLGGPTRRRVRVYSHARTPEDVRADKQRGFTAFKTGVLKTRPYRYVETPNQISLAAERFAELRAAAGDDCDITRSTHLPIATGERVFTKWGGVGLSKRAPLRSSHPTCATPRARKRCPVGMD